MFTNFGGLKDLLMQHIEAGNITRKSIAEHGRMSASTVDRLVSGKAALSVEDWRRLVAGLPAAASDDLKTWALQGLDVQKQVTGDKAAAAGGAVVNSIGGLGELARSVREAFADQTIDLRERVEIINRVNAVRRELDQIEACVAERPQVRMAQIA